MQLPFDLVPRHVATLPLDADVGRRRTILVVDDDPIIVRWLTASLRVLDYHVVAASDLASALTILNHTHVDAAILDLQLVGHSGLDVLEYVRSRRGEASSDLPVLMFTGSRFTDDEEDAIRRHNAYVFYKPEGIAPLAATLDKLFHRHELSSLREVPPAILADYKEACLIATLSPRACATLARRCLQGMIRDRWDVTPGRLVDEIVAIKGKVDKGAWDAIQGVRQVGNIGAHMEHDTNVIVEVEPQEARLLIGLIETLVDEWYSRATSRGRSTSVGAAP